MAYNLDDYNDVPARIAEFRDKYPDGRLRAANPDEPIKIIRIGDQTFLQYVAEALRHENDQAPAIGIAWEPFPGQTRYTRDSEAMNAETSAWGRAIVATLASDTKKIASTEEIRNREVDREARPVPPPPDVARLKAELWQVTQRTDPALTDDERREYIYGEISQAHLDPNKAEDLQKMITILSDPAALVAEKLDATEVQS